MLKVYNTFNTTQLILKPWEVNWYELRDYELLKLEGNLLKELIVSATHKAGNLNKLSQAINMCYVDFWYVLKDRAKLVSVKKLKRLADYSNIDYNYFNDKISEIRKGSIPSIKNPKLPFNLSSKEAATILGNIVSDGCIYIDRKARGVKRTKYSAATKEELEKFVSNINKIFGQVYFQKEKTRGSIYLKIGSSIIAESLCRVGAPTGNKAIINAGLPWLIKTGPEELKIAYLKAVFDDEGSLGGHKNQIYGGKIRRDCFITLSRSIHINNLLNQSQKKSIQKLIPYMKKRFFPTGHKTQSISIPQANKKLQELEGKKSLALSDLLKNTMPKLLSEEMELLDSLGIQSRLRNSGLSITNNGNYSISSELRIIKKRDVLNFYEKINFGLPHKKNKLTQFLTNINWA